MNFAKEDSSGAKWFVLIIKFTLLYWLGIQFVFVAHARFFPSIVTVFASASWVSLLFIAFAIAIWHVMLEEFISVSLMITKEDECLLFSQSIAVFLKASLKDQLLIASVLLYLLICFSTLSTMLSMFIATHFSDAVMWLFYGLCMTGVAWYFKKVFGIWAFRNYFSHNAFLSQKG